MVRLETVEDFEKVREALDDPNSLPHQYCIKGFGYCTACKTLTQYEDSNSFEGCSETCLRCKRTFDGRNQSCSFLSSGDFHYYFTYLNRSQIPKEFHMELDKLRSRKFQERVFLDSLRIFMSKVRSDERKARNRIRRLAKLRTSNVRKLSKRYSLGPS